jgi:hypothetical protein
MLSIELRFIKHHTVNHLDSHRIHTANTKISADGNLRNSHHSHGSLSREEGAGRMGVWLLEIRHFHPDRTRSTDTKHSVQVPIPDDTYETVGIVINAPILDSIPVFRSTSEATLPALQMV